jgi:hypothetical protein
MGVSKAERSWRLYVLIGNQIPAVLTCKCSGDSPNGGSFAIVPGSCHMYLKIVCNILEASKIFLSLFRYLGCNFLILNCLAVYSSLNPAPDSTGCLFIFDIGLPRMVLQYGETIVLWKFSCGRQFLLFYVLVVQLVFKVRVLSYSWIFIGFCWDFSMFKGPFCGSRFLIGLSDGRPRFRD